MKKLLICLLFLIQFVFDNKAFAQRDFDKYPIPKEYEGRFKEEERKYLEYTNSNGEKLANAFNIWYQATKDNREGYNVDSLYSAYTCLHDEKFIKSVEFTKQNPYSYASLYFFNLSLLNSPRFESDSLLSIYLHFSKDLQNTPLGKSIFKSIRTKQSLRLNHSMPVFSFKTDTGREVIFSSFRNQKYVLLCFWDSWCAPCIRNISLLKKIKEAYRDKGLQIISVSIDNNSKKWLESLEKYNMPWLQTCDLPDFISQGSVRVLYDIQLIPQYFLIDKHGKLIYQNIQAKDGDDHLILQEMLHSALD